MKKRIYIADLTHTGKGIHATNFPLGAAYVTSYAKKILEKNFEIELFKFPDELSKKIIEKPPLILGLSNYSWNLELGYTLSSWAKKRITNLIVIFGGPNFPVESSEKKDFLINHPNIDFYIHNEGEISFVELIKKLEDYNFDVEKLKQNHELITNCNYIENGQLIEGPFERIKDLDNIPSPYLTGVLNKFFDYPISPMFESTRGCPFSCTYCADGQISKCKITRFNPERIKNELRYIAKNVKDVDEMIITDLNFGMYEEDIATAKSIVEIQRTNNWPIVIRGSAGKNNPKRIMQISKILKDSFFISSSVQSSDKEVLKNIKRQNISLESLFSFSKFTQTVHKDLYTYSEIILGLPGDTKKKHFESLKYCIDNGIKNLILYQAVMLVGTELATKKSRIEYGIKTKFRVIPGCIGVYKFGDDSFPITAIEEIVVGSKTLSFEDYVSCRVMDLFIETFYNNGIFDEFYAALKAMNVSVFDSLVCLYESEELFSPKMKDIIKSFVVSTKEDLYDSYEDGKNYVLSPDVIKKYLKDELGINEILVHKAEMYLALEDISMVLLNALKKYLAKKNMLNKNVEDYFNQLKDLIVCRKKDFQKCDQEIEQNYNYDFKALDVAGYNIDPRKIEQSKEKFTYKFFHDKNQKNHIKNTLRVYANPSIGISRLLKRSNLKKMYRDFIRIGG